MSSSEMCSWSARGRFNRRSLLKSSMFTAGPLIIPSSVFSDAHKSGANERIDIGVVGEGFAAGI